MEILENPLNTNTQPIFYVEEYFDEVNQIWTVRYQERYIFSPLGKRFLISNESTFTTFQDTTWVFNFDANYEFDPNGFLAKKEEHDRTTKAGVLMTSVQDVFTYSNRCDGAVLTEVINNIENLDICNPSATLKASYRNTYSYGAPADCEPALETFMMEIFPNPTKFKLWVKSELLFFPDTKISLYHSNGQLAFEENAFITLQHKIDLPTLSNGTYFLVIENEMLDKRISNKVVVVN